jgi:hypothetical protein
MIVATSPNTSISAQPPPAPRLNPPGARQFLGTLYGDFFKKAPRLAYIEIRGKRESDKEMTFRRFYLGIKPLIKDMNQWPADLHFWFGVAPRWSDTQGKKEHCLGLTVLFNDVDYGSTGHKKKNRWQTREEAKAAIDAFSIKPSIVVHTGWGFQVYWILSTPFGLENGNYGQIEAIMKGIGAAIGGDDGTQDVSRIFRIPGTFNVKTDVPRPVAMIECHPDRVYDLAAFAHYADQGHQEQEQTRQEVPLRDGPQTTIIDELDVPAWVKGLIRTGDASEYDNDRSKRDHAVIGALKRAGCNLDTIEAIFQAHPVGEKYLEKGTHGRTYLATSIKKLGQPQGEPSAGGQIHDQVEGGEPARIPWVGHFYCVQGGRLSLAVYDGKKWEYKPLANFQARIIEEVTRDDGLKRSKEFKITGSLENRQPLPPAQIAAKEYDSLNWVRREWGAAATMAPGRSHGPHLVNAIQAYSQGFKRRTVYAHTGWRKINGMWRYLHGGGAIGQGELVEVDLGENLRLYRLSEPGGIEAAQASLRFLDIGPWEITAPLLACVYLAPFADADLFRVDFSLWLYGPTGGFKSTLAALALSHYGDFNRLTLPGSWFSTENSLEKLTFVLKDSLMVIDDFIPASNPKEAHSMSAKAGRLIYQAGNRSSRGRLAPDLTDRPNHFPRGLIISTGEILLPGQRQSATARYLGMELDPKKTAIDRVRLTAAQKEAHLYAAATAAYLEDLAPRLEDAQAEIRELWEGYRDAFQSAAHLRIPEIQAWLAVGFELFLKFQTLMGTISQSEADEMLERAWRVFKALGEKHSRMIEGDRPTLKFLAVLRELFYQRRVYVESATVAGAPPQAKETLGWEGTETAKNAELVGWADDGFLYLMPEMTVKVVKETIHRQGDFLSLGKNDLLAALAREGFIEPAKGENTQIKWIQGASKRVICLPIVKLAHDKAP